MSLTSIVAIPAARAFFDDRIHMPPAEELTVIVEPIGGDPRIVGTAFDYALRFGLVAHGYARHHRETVAEEGARLAGNTRRTAKRLEAALRTVHEMGRYPLAEAAAKACLELAAFEWVYRSGGRTGSLQRIRPADPWADRQIRRDFERFGVSLTGS